MLVAGAALTLLGLAAGEAGELHISALSTDSLAAFAYLVVMGSIVAYTAFVWLLDNASVSLVATYAYVTPVVLVLFTAASLFNGLAWNDMSLVVGRAVQGLGAALLVPAALSVLVTIFPEGRDRNRALGIWAAVTAAGGSFGLLLGGVLTDALSWEWIFFINIPIGAVVVGLTPLLLPESRAQLAERRFDFVGAVSITGGLMLLVYALTRAAENSWTSTESIALLAGSVVLIATFVVIETRSPAPLLPLRMFRLRTLAGSNLSGLFSGVSFVVFFLGSLYAQLVLNYSAIETGAAFLAASLSIVLGSGIAQSLTAAWASGPWSRPDLRLERSGWCCSHRRRSTVTTSPTCSRPSSCSDSGCHSHLWANKSAHRSALRPRMPGSPPG